MFANDASQYMLRNELATCCNGIGTVYLAHHKPSGEPVAIKRFKLDKTRADNHIISDEILAMRQFNHPHILQIHAAFTANNNGAGELHVVMPLMCFGSCRDMLNNFFITGFPEPIVALLLRDALIGLDYLHRRGVVHRALRASHILVNRSRALLCGFRDCVSLVAHGERVRTLHELPGSRSSGGGATANNTARTSGAAALPLASKAAAASTSAANPSKHLNWLAPEVLEQNVLGYTEKADVYSVGIMTCELANSLEPFADMPTTFMLTEKIRGNTPALLDCSTCPPPIDSVVGDSLAETRQIYGTRALSDNFHKFAEICMSRYPVERPTVAQLLGHAFFKQNKQTSLYEQLQLTGAEILDCTKIKDESVALSCDFGEMNIQGGGGGGAFEWDF